ncbi:MAG: hypothetical protein K8I30_11900, partial [Anaerolineae bacterium]|nr:hypothetical protein [Anaerolineae bacterium]
MKRRIFGIIFLALLSLTPAAVSVYGDGNGVVVEGNPVGTEGIGTLNPLLCSNPYCRRITDFLFPTLYAVDPATGLITPVSTDNNGLALEVSAPTTSPAQLRLRDDRVWSDGTPVTAYDVFYSYLAISSGFIDTPYLSVRNLISAARVVDEYTIEFAYNETNCSIPARSTFPIVPAHVFDPNFRPTVDDFGTDGDLDMWFKSWSAIYRRARFGLLNNHAFNTAPTVSAGVFRFDEILPGEEIRLKDENGDIAFIYRDIEPGMDATQFLLNGGSNLLLNPPYEKRDDLLANPDLEIAQMPGSTWDYIAFNLAHPRLARGAFDGNGVELEQGQHPIFGDLRVRQAIQKAINVPELIEATLQGYGVPVASSRVPGTWAANDALQPPAYDPRGAEQLLEQAGWRDVDEDGVRECVSCQYASRGRGLNFDLMVVSDSRREIAANLIARQLFEVGISMSIRPMDSNSVFDEARYQQ